MLRIGIICSEGGHLTEAEQLLPALQQHDLFFVTYDGNRGRALSYRRYLFRDTGQAPVLLALYAPRFLGVLLREKPDLLISTGAEIALPFFAFAKLLGVRTCFIESWCRVTSPSMTGRLIYPFSDEFLVQWPELLPSFGPKAQYRGAVV